MVDSEVDREHQLSTVKDSAVRISSALRTVAQLIDDPDTASPEDAKRAFQVLGETINDSDSLIDLETRLESVVEFDEMS